MSVGYVHALHWNISSCFRFALCQYSEYHYDYYQFLEGCQSGVVERVTVPDQAAPNLFIYFIVLWPLTQIGSGFLVSVPLFGNVCLRWGLPSSLIDFQLSLCEVWLSIC